jgi:hypothetical protein
MTWKVFEETIRRGQNSFSKDELVTDDDDKTLVHSMNKITIRRMRKP